jgi:hypothetical protein
MFSVVQLHHANVALPSSVDRRLRVFIVTPFMHKVNHSRRQPETDSTTDRFSRFGIVSLGPSVSAHSQGRLNSASRTLIDRRITRWSVFVLYP